MAEFVEVMKNLRRMCNCDNQDGYECDNCPLSIGNNGTNDGCNLFSMIHPAKTEKIIMDWAKEHPPITNADKFREVFGYEVDKSGYGCNGVDFGCLADCEKCEYKYFWNKEYKEQKNEM